MGGPGRTERSLSADSSDLTRRIGTTSRSRAIRVNKRPTPDAAAFCRMYTGGVIGGFSELCPALINTDAVTVLISICAAISSGVLSGTCRRECLFVITYSPHLPVH